MNVKSTKGI